MDKQPIIIIGCGKNKLGFVAPAAEMYQGPLFIAALAYARSITVDENIRIFSAKHGFLRLDTKIEPYDVTWKMLAQFIRSDEVAKQIPADWEDRPIWLLAGEDYAARLGWALTERFGREIEFNRPLRGLPIGKQLSWFKSKKKEPVKIVPPNSVEIDGFTWYFADRELPDPAIEGPQVLIWRPDMEKPVPADVGVMLCHTYATNEHWRGYLWTSLNAITKSAEKAAKILNA